MSNYFGLIPKTRLTKNSHISTLLAKCAEQGGRNSSSIITASDGEYNIYHADEALTRLMKGVTVSDVCLLFGQTGSESDGLFQSLCTSQDGLILINDGIPLPKDGAIGDKGLSLSMEIIESHLTNGLSLEKIPSLLYDCCDGMYACTVFFLKQGKAMLFSNNGGLYLGDIAEGVVFATDLYSLRSLGCKEIKQIIEPIFVDIPRTEKPVKTIERRDHPLYHIPNINKQSIMEEQLLAYLKPELRRCSKCLLPETMPFIHFDAEGVCNYCHNYRIRNQPKPQKELFELVERYRRHGQVDCIVPFSGGRDSSYGLHLIVKELGMKPVAYTYDWGMVTDLAYRNVSRMCGALGVENIVVAADVRKKRDNISRNLGAWLKSPHLGMISILTAGDKHFFKYVQDIKEQTGVSLNLWGVNPLEVTHFKAGFLGVKPDFEEDRVYTSGAMKQLRYHWLRTRAMLGSLGYFNSSLWDTLSGEYYRSFAKKEDYFHIFDYWKWDERQIEDTLDEYGWERAHDTNSTWRIGDGTAGFYNYVYHTVAGFTEHDTFRSNQIREGDITREEGLRLIEEENRPRYQNIKWYLDTLGFDFVDVVSTINAIPKLYSEM